VTLTAVTPAGTVKVEVPVVVNSSARAPPVISLVRATVPVESGNVRVWLLLELGEVMVNVPVPPALPFKAILLISTPYRISQRWPEDTVTVMPEFMVIGPILIAF
jgi:hypothetical protein